VKRALRNRSVSVDHSLSYRAPEDKLIDLPPEKWTPGYAVFRSACSGVM
jgi:hypothetical protein